MSSSRAARGIVVALMALTVLSVLPFLPGPYDPLAVPLFLMARVVGTAGLVLVPFGALRLAAERVPRFARWQFAAAALAAIATLPIWALVLVAAVSQGALVVGAGLLWGVVIALRRTWRTLVEMRRGTPARRHVMPLYLAAVPLGVALLQFVLLDRAVAMSRARAIRNAAPLIAAIERHRDEQGRYPESLLAAWLDGYSPGVMGIERYQYEPQGESYNLIFEQVSDRIGTREFVVYNPRDEQTFTAHVTDILRLTPEQLALERTRGHYAVHDAAPHWKYFWFD